MSKILQFPGAPMNREVLHGMPMIPADPTAHIHTLLELPRTHIYTDRFDRDPQAAFFFTRLIQLGKVTIVYDGEIDRESLLKVGIGTLEIFDLSVGEFVDFVSVHQDGVFLEDVEVYLMSALEGLGIHVNIVQVWHESRKIIHIHDKSLDIFDVSEVFMAHGTPEYVDNYCNVGVYLDSDEDFQFLVTVNEFKNPIGLPLAYILSHLRQEYLINGYSLDSVDANVVVEFFTWIYVHELIISADILDDMLLVAVKKLTPQFASFSNAQCLGEFYKRIVLPKLKDDKHV